ncbi:MAG: hypothetical protein FWE07_02340 [Turicibacter sp.]|nr:hypothetical protein [Turicibacter sp.]
MKLKQIVGLVVLVVLLVGGYFLADRFLGYQFSYDTFELAIRSPQGRGAAMDYEGQRITFTVQITSHSMDLHFDDGTNADYVSAIIARSPNRPFLINVEGLDDVPSPGDVVQVTGRVNGSIRTLGETTIGDQSGVFLNLDASAFEAVDHDGVEVNIGYVYEDLRGAFILHFDRAEAFTNFYDHPAVIIHFDYEALEDHLLRGLDDLLVIQDGVVLEGSTGGISMSLLDEEDFGRLASSRVAGDRVYTISTFVLANDADSVTIVAYNDDFQRIFELELPILERAAE